MNNNNKNPLDIISNFSQLEYELTKSIIFNQTQVSYSSIQQYLIKCIEAIKEDNETIDKWIKEFSYRDDFVRCYYIYGSNIPNELICDTVKRFYFIVNECDLETDILYNQIFQDEFGMPQLNYERINVTPYTEDEEEQLISWLLVNQNYKVYEKNSDVKVVMNNDETNII